MRFKKTALVISALLLTGCEAQVHGEYYETVSETESVTVSLTEPEPEPEPFITESYDLGAFLPIVDKYKENAELEDKLRPYVEKIIMGEALLYYAEMFSDDLPYGEKLTYPNEWAVLDKSFAENKEQLLNFFNTVYTDDYRDGLYSCSFEEGLFGGSTGTNIEEPCWGEQVFKEENGAVYKHIVWGAKGMKRYSTDSFRVRAYDGKTAEIGLCYGDGYGYGYEVFYLRHDEGRGWRLDGKGADYNSRTFAVGNDMNFGAGAQRFEIALLDENLQGVTVGPEFVFTHFNETIDNEYIEYNGFRYYQVRNYYPVEKMRKAFENYISEYKWEWSDKAEDFVQTDKPLLQPCIEKYINDVYVEFSGMLYRKEGAPVYEIDCAEYDPYSKESQSAIIETPFHLVEIYTSGSGDKVLFVEERDERNSVLGYKLADDLPLREKEE